MLADAHVHLYECFDLAALLDAAYDNFRSQASRLDRADDFVGLLLLTESHAHDWFRRLRDGSANPGATHTGSKSTPPWTFHPTEESLSVLASRGPDRRLALIAGRQLGTHERLEVLALATQARLPQGLSLLEAVERIRGLGGIPVIPWGAGKWLGRRGRFLTRFLHQDCGSDLFLGDNSGRPAFWARPRHFRLAERLGIRILPGSDALPIPAEGSRAGSFGFWAFASVSTRCPGRDLIRMLRDPRFRPRPYGSLETPRRFLRHQIGLQLRKRYPTSEPCEPS